MPQTCTICRHKDREAIDREILAGDPLRNIAEQFGISLTALHRHKQNDIPAALTQAKQAAEETQAETLFDRLRELNRETSAILREARALATRDNDLALKAIARAEKQLELEARLLGELNEEKKIAFGIAVQETNSRNSICRALLLKSSCCGTASSPGRKWLDLGTTRVACRFPLWRLPGAGPSSKQQRTYGLNGKRI